MKLGGEKSMFQLILTLPKRAYNKLKHGFPISRGLNTKMTIVVHSEGIQTPGLFPHFVMLQPYSKMIKLLFPQSTHNAP
jgi:hypothetical protein